MKRKWRVEVSHLPPSLNAFYAGMHWGKRKALMDEWHGLWRAAFLDVGLPKPLGWPIEVKCVVESKRRPKDADNAILAVKTALDTLTLYGYLPDDAPDYVSQIILSSKKGTENKTIIVIIYA